MGQPIKVDYGAMEDAAQAMSSSSRTIEEKLSQLDSELKRIEWDGQDREAYAAHKAKWDAAVQHINEILMKVSGAVTTAREGYGQTEQSGVSAWH